MKQALLHTAAAALTLLLLISSEVPAQENGYRYELGGQFSSLSLSKLGEQEPFLMEEREPPGFGGRFTYNLTNNIAFEAEVDFFQGHRENFGIPHGHMTQGQFGVKAGKRFTKLGFFGKARPGFVRFNRVSKFSGSRTIVFINMYGAEVHQEIPEFGYDEETYSSVDVGGVVEFYPSRRLTLRFDAGDTVIRYGVVRESARDVCVISAPYCPANVFERPPETRHNLQLSVGVGVRF